MEGWVVGAIVLLLVSVAILFALVFTFADKRGRRGIRGRAGTNGILGVDGRAGPTGTSGPTGADGVNMNMPKSLFAFADPGSTAMFMVPTTSNGFGLVRLYGGGGGGAGAVQDRSSIELAGGGGGGAYVEADIFAPPGSLLLVTVGAGGTGGSVFEITTVPSTGPAGLGAGFDGGDSAISGLVSPFPSLTAGGGFGAPGTSTGFDNGSGPFVSRLGSLGGTGGIPDPQLGVNGDPFVGLFGQMGGGGATQDFVAGEGGSCPKGGQGGIRGLFSSYSDFPAAPPDDPAAGGPGTSPGGGGGGGARTSLTGAKGGDGAPGLVLIYI